MKSTSEIVAYLEKYFYLKNDQNITEHYPDTVNDLLKQLSNFLDTRMTDDTPFKNIWAEFRINPEEYAASLTGELEALFEAQPAVRERVNGFMEKITAIEAKKSDLEYTQINIEDSLESGPGSLVSDEGKKAAILADKKQEKEPPAYLYGNERAGYEANRRTPEINPFLVGENAQIINVPTEKAQFPFMFMHLGRLTETSKDLNLNEKDTVKENIDIIRLQLTGEIDYDGEEMANAFERIWEIAPSYANSLIKSLQKNVDQLPLDARAFIIQLDPHSQ